MENSLPAKTYRTTLGNKIAVGILAGFFVASGPILMAGPLFESFVKTLSQVVILEVFGLFSFLTGLWGLLFTLQYQVETEAGRIRVTSFLYSKEMAVQNIASFIINPTNWIQFRSKEGGRTMKVMLWIDDQKQIQEWAKENFKDELETEKQNEVSDILADEKFGSDEAQRSKSLKKAQKWIRVLNPFSTIVGLWALFYPRPYYPLAWTLILTPLLAMLSMLWFKGLIRFNVKKNSGYPAIDLALLFPISILGMRAILDWHILDWSPFWIPFCALSGFTFGLLLFCSGNSPKDRGWIIFGIIFCVAYSCVAIININGLADYEKSSVFSPQVVDKRISRGKHTFYYMTLTPWGPIQGNREYTIDRGAYDRHPIGDMVQVYLKKGALNIPHYYVY